MLGLHGNDLAVGNRYHGLVLAIVAAGDQDHHRA